MTDTIDLDLQAHEFAQAVRAHLSDLDADEVDDLTEGLEADLIEQARETGSFLAGDPADYASELRVAAGMPVRAGSRPGFITAVRAEWTRLVARARAFMASSPALTAISGFLGSLRAIWWIVRAALGYMVFDGITNVSRYFGPPSVLVFIVLLVISIQWGRGKWMPRPWLRVVRTAANILAILVIPLGMQFVSTQVNTYVYNQSSTNVPYAAGLSHNGDEITNIFAYDANGDPISGVQLFDQDGKALGVRQDSSSDYLFANGRNYFMVPSDQTAGSSGWNIFPLSRVPQSALDDENQLKAGITATKVLFPFVKVRPVIVAAEPSPTASQTVNPTPIP
jgi:hypothetical protein